MPRWEGIVDASSEPPEPVWLSRPHVAEGTTPDTTTSSTSTSTSTTTTTVNTGSTSGSTTTSSTTATTVVWKPLRKCDCRLLNERYKEYLATRRYNTDGTINTDDTTTTTTTGSTTTNNNNIKKENRHLVYIDGGRKVVNFNDMTILPTYGRIESSSSSSSPMILMEIITPATWFVRYDYHHNTHGKYVTISNNNNSNSNSSSSTTTTTSQPQQQIEYKEDGTIVNSSYILYPIINVTEVQQIETFYQEIIKDPIFTTTTASLSSSTSSLHKITESNLFEKSIEVDQGTYKVQLQYNKNNDVVSLRKVPNETGWISNIVQFKPSYTIQRGYKPYTVPNEDIELGLGPIQHIVFVIHGIGEAYFHRTDIQITGMIQQTNQLRTIIQNKQYTTWKLQCQNILKKNQKHSNKNNNSDSDIKLPPPPNRIEFIPIEWYHCLHGSSPSYNHFTTSTKSNNNNNNNNTSSSTTEDLLRNLQLVTLNTIPALRTIANDVLLDVLLYNTPNFGSIVLHTVTEQIKLYYNTFTQYVDPNFIKRNGKVSLIGHSLGSVIVWDLLATAKQLQQQHQHRTDKDVSKRDEQSLDDNGTSSDRTDISDQILKMESINVSSTSQTASYGPTIFPPMTEMIPFVPEYSLLLGSPLGMFLSLRNATQLFHLETTTTTTTTVNNTTATVSSFTLPTNHLYNIFHPSDPVAYRIEPLLLMVTSQSAFPSLFSNLPEPVYLTVPGEDVRLHVKAIQFTNVVRKSLFSTSSNSGNLDRGTSRKSSHNNGGSTSTSSGIAISSWTSLLESAMANVSSTTQQQTDNTNDIDSGNTDPKGPSLTQDSATTGSIRFPLGGPQNPRIDYCLQPMIVDNEYISAVTAHSSYFSNTDVQDFLIGIMK